MDFEVNLGEEMVAGESNFLPIYWFNKWIHEQMNKWINE